MRGGAGRVILLCQPREAFQEMCIQKSTESFLDCGPSALSWTKQCEEVHKCVSMQQGENTGMSTCMAATGAMTVAELVQKIPSYANLPHSNVATSPDS
eukprot:2034779-Amphidinium_carterae.1